jgi:hypothetical protein
MKIEEMDRLIERYAEERKRETRQVAQEHFLAYAYLVCGAGEVEQFMKTTRSLVTYYIDSLSLFENPFRNSRAHWLLFMLLWLVLSIYLMNDEVLYIVGIVNFVGTIIFSRSLWKIIWTEWMETSLLIAYYNEIVDFIDSQQRALNAVAVQPAKAKRSA